MAIVQAVGIVKRGAWMLPEKVRGQDRAKFHADDRFQIRVTVEAPLTGNASPLEAVGAPEMIQDALLDVWSGGMTA